MELFDHFRANRRFFLFLALLPVVAGAVTYLAVRDLPERHRGSITLALPSGIADSNAGSVAQWIVGFTEALDSDPVIEEVAAATGIDADDVEAGLSGTQDGRSAQVIVRFEGEDPDAAPGVLEVAVPAALEAVSLPQQRALELAESELAEAQDRRDEAVAARDALLAGTGVLDPSAELTRAQADLTSLRTDLAVALRTAPEDVPSLQASVSELELRVLFLQQLAAEAAPLNEEVDNAEEALSDARRRDADAEAVLAGLLEPATVTDVTLRTISPTPAIRRAILTSVGAGVLAAVALAALQIASNDSGPFARRRLRIERSDSHGLPWPGRSRASARRAAEGDDVDPDGEPPEGEVADEFARFVDRLGSSDGGAAQPPASRSL